MEGPEENRQAPRTVTIADFMRGNRYKDLAVDNEECTEEAPVKETIEATHVPERNRSACGRSEPRSVAYSNAIPGLRTTSPVVQRPSGLLQGLSSGAKSYGESSTDDVQSVNAVGTATSKPRYCEQGKLPRA